MTDARTRAIVEAAERLAQHAQQRDVIDITGRVVDRAWTLCDVSQIGSRLVELNRALALPAEPAPAWTTVEPTENGYYWTRFKGLGEIFYYKNGRWERCGDTYSFSTKMMTEAGYSWLPVPLQTPQ